MKTITYYCPTHWDAVLYKELVAQKPTEHVTKFFSDVIHSTLDHLLHPGKAAASMFFNTFFQGATPMIDILDDGPFECKKCGKFYMKKDCIAVEEE